jgi:TetR/AcrR family transcriptional regulator, tetracycline repressor protein
VRGSLTRQEIAKVALALLDEHGLEAVTMRQIAAALDVGVMSLYVYAANKDEIIQAATDLVLADLEPPERGADLRSAVISFFERFHRTLLEHPSVAQTITAMPLLGPATFVSMDALFGVLAAAGLTATDAVAAVTELTSFTLGFTAFSIARDHAPAAIADSRRRGFMAIDPGQLPNLHAVRGPLLEGPSASQFSVGLTRLAHALIPPACETSGDDATA